MLQFTSAKGKQRYQWFYIKPHFPMPSVLYVFLQWLPNLMLYIFILGIMNRRCICRTPCTTVLAICRDQGKRGILGVLRCLNSWCLCGLIVILVEYHHLPQFSLHHLSVFMITANVPHTQFSFFQAKVLFSPLPSGNIQSPWPFEDYVATVGIQNTLRHTNQIPYIVSHSVVNV